MIQYYCEKDFVLNVNNDEIVFYVYSDEDITKTIIWKYDLNNNQIGKCAEISEKLILSKYIHTTNDDVSYIGIKFNNKGYVIGLNCIGEKKFEYEIGGITNIPIFDDKGNIYIIVNQVQIRCLTKEGREIWRWSPQIDMSRKFLGEKSIIKYWIFQNLLYVVANGQLFQISLEGESRECYNIESCNFASNIEIQGDNLLFSSLDRRSIVCCNMRGKQRWRYDIKSSEMIKTINSNLSYTYVSTRDIMDNSERMYVLDKNGQAVNIVNLEKISYAYFFEEQVVILNRGSINLCDKIGENIFHYSIEDNIIWARNVRENVYSIIKSNGSLAVMMINKDNMRNNCRVELIRQDDNRISELSEDLELWVNIFAEYLARNIRLCKKYIGEVKIKECDIYYTYNDVYDVRAIIDNSSSKSLLVKSIPEEMILDEDLDEYKEVKNINIIWMELCNSVSEGNVGRIFERVCYFLKNEFNYSIRCETNCVKKHESMDILIH